MTSDTTELLLWKCCQEHARGCESDGEAEQQLVKAEEEEKFFMSSDCSQNGSQAGAGMGESWFTGGWKQVLEAV